MQALSFQSSKTLKGKLRYIYAGARYFAERLLQRIYFKGYFVVFKSPLEMRVPPLKRVNIELDFKVCGPDNFDDLRDLAPPWKIRAFEKRLKKGCLAIIGYSQGIPVSYCWFAEDSGKIEDFDYHLPKGEVYAFDAWVNPTFRGRGIAYYNFKFIYEFFKTRGFHTYLGIVQSWNRTMLRMYDKVKIDFYGILRHRSFLGMRKTCIIPPGEEENRVEQKFLANARLKLPPRDIKFKLINSQKKFDHLKDSWEKLHHVLGGQHFFLTHEWLSNWWSHCRQGHRLFIIAGFHGGDLVSLFPFCISQTITDGGNALGKSLLKARVIELMGTGLPHQKDFLIHGDMPGLIVSMLDLLHGPLADQWDMANLAGLEQESETFRSLVNVLYERGLSFQIVPSKANPILPAASSPNLGNEYPDLPNEFRFEFETIKLPPIELAKIFSLIEERADRQIFPSRVFSDANGRKCLLGMLDRSEAYDEYYYNLLKINGSYAAYSLGFNYNGKYNHLAHYIISGQSVRDCESILLKKMAEDFQKAEIKSAIAIQQSSASSLELNGKQANHFTVRIFNRNFRGYLLRLIYSSLKSRS